MADGFFQYCYKETFIHRLNPTTKLLAVFFISTFLFFFKSYLQFVLSSAFIVLLAVLSKIKIRNITKNLKPFLFFFVFILAMYLLSSEDKITEGIITIWRFILLIAISSILLFTTSATQIVYSIEKILKPLKIFKISSRDIALMVSTAMRFVPLLAYEADNVKDAQISRGADLKKIKHVHLFVASVLNRTFNKANSIADAIESRCYRNNGYTKLTEYRMSYGDFIACLGLCFFFAISVI